MRNIRTMIRLAAVAALAWAMGIAATLASIGGSMLGQYLMYVNPETLSGVMVSLQMLFASVVGGMFTAIGPTVGSALTITLTEYLRILFGTKFIGGANTIYGILLVVLTIFMPVGIWGLAVRWFEQKKRFYFLIFPRMN